MQLTQFTDFSLRILLYLNAKPTHELTSIAEVATYFDVSKPHLVKAANNLAHHGFIITLRGKGGGMRLSRPADQIKISDVVRITEPTFDLVECFDMKTNKCRIARGCRLAGALYEAKKAFFAVLEKYTLEDAMSTGFTFTASCEKNC